MSCEEAIEVCSGGPQRWLNMCRQLARSWHYDIYSLKTQTSSIKCFKFPQ